MINIAELSHYYHYDKICVLENIIPATLCTELVTRIQKLIRSDFAISLNSTGLGNKKVLDGGGTYRHKVLDGSTCRTFLPELVAIYHSLIPLISLITTQEVIVSPYEKSDINVKIYTNNEDSQGWHYDTNAITALLYLTDNTEGATSCNVAYKHPSQTEDTIVNRKIFPKAGRLLLMQGREVWHCAEVMKNELKISVPLNYYTVSDTWRPNGIDDLVYGKLETAAVA